MFAVADAPQIGSLLFLRAWLTAEGEHMDNEVLSSIRTFASTVSGSDTMRQVAQEIVECVGKNVRPVPLKCINCRLTIYPVS